jgi:hypothetical protein
VNHENATAARNARPIAIRIPCSGARRFPSLSNEAELKRVMMPGGDLRQIEMSRKLQLMIAKTAINETSSVALT